MNIRIGEHVGIFQWMYANSREKNGKSRERNVSDTISSVLFWDSNSQHIDLVALSAA